MSSGRRAFAPVIGLERREVDTVKSLEPREYFEKDLNVAASGWKKKKKRKGY